MEEERARIARDLHDELGQTLTAIVLEAERLAESAETGRIVEWARAAQRELERICNGLRPDGLEDLGLRSALVSLCRRVERESGLAIRWSVPERLEADLETETAIYRVIQESLTNVVRHANASAITVVISEDGDVLRVEISDNGQGIAREAQAGHGTRGMQERSRLVGGALEVGRAPEHGTRVTMQVPHLSATG